MIFDSHCHLHDEKFKDDLSEVLQRAKEANVTHFVTIGCDIETTQNAAKIANEYENVYFSAGFHPHDAQFLTDENFLLLKELAKNKNCVAIGECGLDYFYNNSTEQAQKKAFIAQIELAKELDLPLIIHLRDAYEDCLDIFKKHLSSEQKVVIHCFSGTYEQALVFTSMGFYLSIPGIITFKKPGSLPEVAKDIPLNQLLIETDAPYLAPHPFRGQRNEPSFITKTLEAVANYRNEPKDKIEKILFENTMKFFGLKN